MTVYDRHDRIGGLLTYGIPNFKLEKHVVERRARRLIDARRRVRAQLATLAAMRASRKLRAKHDAILIATGTYAARPLNAPNDSHVVQALDFLFTANRVGFGDKVETYENGTLNAKGRRVVVIGGGDTAMDCVRTAVRQGAKSVTCLYRRDRANMPGSQREVTHAEEEGVAFDWLAAPKAVRAGKAPGVKAVRMRLGAPDASGRQAPEETPGSEYNVAGDLIIAALGFDPENLPSIVGKRPTSPSRAGARCRSTSASATSMPGVYAAGDIVRGASLVVWAVKDGRDAANAIHADLSAQVASAKVAAE